MAEAQGGGGGGRLGLQAAALPLHILPTCATRASFCASSASRRRDMASMPVAALARTRRALARFSSRLHSPSHPRCTPPSAHGILPVEHCLFRSDKVGACGLQPLSPVDPERGGGGGGRTPAQMAALLLRQVRCVNVARVADGPTQLLLPWLLVVIAWTDINQVYNTSERLRCVQCPSPSPTSTPLPQPQSSQVHTMY